LLLLLASGCATAFGSTAPPLPRPAFDQREFRTPDERYREWTPDASGANVWWERDETVLKPYRPQHLDLFENRTARYNYFRAAGKPVADICVISCTSASNHQARVLGLAHLLMRAHRNVELFDEQHIAKRGSRFVSDMAGYGAVVVSWTDTIHISTVALLARFAQKGGVILFDRAYPQTVEGIENPAMLKTLINAAPLVPNGEWRQALASRAPPLFMLEGEDTERVETALRAVQGGYALELTNTRWDKAQTLALHVADTPARAALLDPVSGKTLVLRPAEDGSYRITLVPRQTWIVCYGKLAKNFAFDGFYSPPGPRKEIAKLDDEWHGERIDPNVLPLDPKRFTRTPDDNGGLRFRCAVTVEDVPAVCELAVEEPERYAAILVNGIPVTCSTNEYPTCRLWTFRTADISPLLTAGENAIEVVSLKGELGSICLWGDFAVNASRPSVAKESAFALGDLAGQGYPFYSGTFMLETAVDLPRPTRGIRYLLTFPTFDTAVLHASVNGVLFDPVIAKPWETDISAALRPGRNSVRIWLTNSANNEMNGLLGNNKTPIPFGLFQPPVIVEQN